MLVIFRKQLNSTLPTNEITKETASPLDNDYFYIPNSGGKGEPSAYYELEPVEYTVITSAPEPPARPSITRVTSEVEQENPVYRMSTATLKHNLLSSLDKETVEEVSTLESVL